MAEKLGFMENFMLSGIAAGISKTAAAPIERVKLLVQNQDEMLKTGRLDKPYTGVVDCTKRVLASEGVGPFWRGNLANVLRYFPTQALNFAFKDSIKAQFKVAKDASVAAKLAANVAAGGMAGSLSLTVVYSLDFARTRLANDNKGADENDNSTDSSMSTKRLLLPMVSKVSTEDSLSRALVSSSTEDSTSDSTIPFDQSFSEKKVPLVPVSFWDGLSLLSVDWLLTQLIPSEGV
jgi:hypothetical protein